MILHPSLIQILTWKREIREIKMTLICFCVVAMSECFYVNFRRHDNIKRLEIKQSSKSGYLLLCLHAACELSNKCHRVQSVR